MFRVRVRVHWIHRGSVRLNRIGPCYPRRRCGFGERDRARSRHCPGDTAF